MQVIQGIRQTINPTTAVTNVGSEEMPEDTRQLKYERCPGEDA